MDFPALRDPRNAGERLATDSALLSMIESSHENHRGHSRSSLPAPQNRGGAERLLREGAGFARSQSGAGGWKAGSQSTGEQAAHYRLEAARPAAPDQPPDQ